MGAAYDNYKFTEATMREPWQHDRDCAYVVTDGPAPCTCDAGKIETYLGPNNQLIADKLKSLEQEIAWNINRLGYLVLSDEDRQQTEDYILTLRQERESLKRCFNV